MLKASYRPHRPAWLPDRLNDQCPVEAIEETPAFRAALRRFLLRRGWFLRKAAFRAAIKSMTGDGVDTARGLNAQPFRLRLDQLLATPPDNGRGTCSDQQGRVWPLIDLAEIEHGDAGERPVGVGRHQRAFCACAGCRASSPSHARRGPGTPAFPLPSYTKRPLGGAETVEGRVVLAAAIGDLALQRISSATASSCTQGNCGGTGTWAPGR